jgi:tetratricopeptide (TPR) repeat protein
MAIPRSCRENAFIESLFVCGNPECFHSDPLQVHHINGRNTDDRPDNLIVLCGRCHTRCHYGPLETRLSQDNCIKFKKYLSVFVPNRYFFLDEILRKIDLYYEYGDFYLIKNIIFILFKAISRDDKLRQNLWLIGWLNELLAEVYVQQGFFGNVSKHIFNSIEIFREFDDHDRLSHCQGLIAISMTDNRNYRAAQEFLSEAIQKFTNRIDDYGERNRRIGWLFNLQAYNYREYGDIYQALLCNEKAIDYYTKSYNILNKREEADFFFELAKILISENTKLSLTKADTLLDASLELINNSHWVSKKASYYINKFKLYLDLMELEEAKKCFSKAWEVVDKNILIHKERDLLKLVIEYPAYCPNEIKERLYQKHDSCKLCARENIKAMAQCSLESERFRNYTKP